MSNSGFVGLGNGIQENSQPAVSCLLHSLCVLILGPGGVWQDGGVEYSIIHRYAANSGRPGPGSHDVKQCDFSCFSGAL